MPPNRSADRIVPLASVAALVMLAQLLAGKATRDALFLATFGARALPYAIVGAGIVAFAGAIPVARALARFGPSRTVPVLFAGSAASFTAEWLLIGASPRGVAAFLYLHLAAASALLVSGFWATLNERFDPHGARASLARVASFGTLGGMLGGLLSERVSAWFGLETTLIVMAGMHGVCAVLVAAIGRHAPLVAAPPDAAPIEERGLPLLRRTPYLRWMAAASLVLAVLDALLDFAIRASADARYGTGDELVRFFGFYYTGVGLVTFVVQSTLTVPLLARAGIGRAMSSLPVAVASTGLLALLVPGLPSIVATRGAGSVLTNSVFRTGFELLYTPLPPRIKRPTKTLVDVGGQRLGDVVGGGLVLAVIAIVPSGVGAGVLVLAIVSCAALAVVLGRLQGAYRTQLAQNLQSGELSLDELDTLARSVAETQVRLDRSEILARIHETGLGRASGGPTPGAADVAALIDGLGDASLAGASARALRGRGPGVADALMDALASPDRSDLVKLMLPGLLESIREPRVVAALLDAMACEPFEVRFRCARSVVRMTEDDPTLALGPERVLAALRAEIANPTDAPLPTASPVGADRADSVLIADLPHLRVGRRIEHVCTLLALDHGRDLMRSVLLGLHGGDAAMRGTALEYLEATLPDDLRRGLQPLLGGAFGGARGPSRRARAAQQLEAELRRAAQADIVSGSRRP